MNNLRLLFLLLLCHLILSSYAQSVIVLGVAQDGGFPHIGCQSKCQEIKENPELGRFVVSLAIVDSISNRWWLMEATPDMPAQLDYFRALTDGKYPFLPEGIFITHAHIGHYAGLMFLGREALGSKDVKVYALPKLIEFIQKNGPWSQLVILGNIRPLPMTINQAISLSDQIAIEAFTVPHRDEFSETAGFKIETGQKSYLFIPDIDKWSKWSTDIRSLVRAVDYAFLDASFYADGELPNRSMREVPHPFVTETIELFDAEDISIRQKIHFIHFNHTNPLLWDQELQDKVKQQGFGIAEQGDEY